MIHAKRQPAAYPDHADLIAEADAYLASQNAQHSDSLVRDLRGALAAQPVQGDAKLLQNSLDPEKVADLLEALDGSDLIDIADALCEAAKRGELHR